MNQPCGCNADDQPCGCCAGVDPQTPAQTVNPPGLAALRYRVGTHPAFLETMKARLASRSLPSLANLTARTGDDPSIAMLDAWATVADVLTFYQERIANEGYLRTATERRSILELARLVGYSLRPGVASSVYLAYELEQPQPAAPQPGQQAVARTGSAEANNEIEIPAGSRAQSTPAPGEQPQAFETSEPLRARAAWNTLQPRLTRPQNLLRALAGGDGTIYLKGTATNLKPNDPLLIRLRGVAGLFRVVAVRPDTPNDRTAVDLELWARDTDLSPRVALLRRTVARFLELEQFGINPRSKTASAVIERLTELRSADDPQARLAEIMPALRSQLATVRLQLSRGLTQFTNLHRWLSGIVDELDQSTGQASLSVSARRGEDQQPIGLEFSTLIRQLEAPPTLPPRNRALLSRSARQAFSRDSDASARILGAIRPEIRRTLYDGWRNLPLAIEPEIEVYALRARGSVFGHNAPLRSTVRRSFDGEQNETTTIEYSEWNLYFEGDDSGEFSPVTPAEPIVPSDQVMLDTSAPQIVPGSWVVVERPQPLGTSASPLLITVAVAVDERSQASYGISGKGTHLALRDDWLDTERDRNFGFSLIRGTAIYGGSELLDLAEVPLDAPIAGDEIELGDLYDGLEAGRWLIVAGERADIEGVDGVPAAELVMLAGVRQGVDRELPGDRPRTTLLLATPLAYRYKLATARIYGNVVHATHGETRVEVLGSGDGSKPFQQWTLRQPPLTFVSAPTPAGAETTLQVFVNDIRWHESPSLFELGPTDRGYVTRGDDDQKTTVIFGNGEHGARLPSGRENVRAVYRTGIGKAGNVAGGAITLLSTRPLGVKGVINPLPATGGADRESRDQARENVPLGVTALDRLVSVQDYEDFARTFAGIGKSSALRMSDGQRLIVHVTVAGADGIPIALTSDLYRNLRAALSQWGDPHLPIVLAIRELVVLIISANVRINPDYLWEKVEPKIRAALLDRFGFARRRLGEDALLSHAIAAIQAIDGVEYVDVDLWGGVPEQVFNAETGSVRTPTPDEIGRQIRRLEREQRAPAGPPARVPIDLARLDRGTLRAAQIGVLLPTAPDTILLRRLP